MSTRQYIGARYVPKFFEWEGSSEWVSGVAYEPLTIVTRSGNSYTSKKPVPTSVGAPESNPEYWVATGLYNEQVETIREGLVTAQGDIETLEGEVSDIDSQLYDPKKPVGMKKCLFISDSYGAGYHSGNDNWITGVINKLGLASGEYDVNAIGSTGFAYTNGSGENFRTMLTTLNNRETTEFKNEVTHIFVCGGANDTLSTFSDVVTGIQQFDTLASEYYPNAKVYIGFVGCTNDATKIKTYGDTCNTYVLTSGKHCYLNGVEYILRNRNYISSDNVHPNTSGYNALSHFIYRAIMTGSCDVRYNQSRGVIGTTERELVECIDNGLYNITTNNLVSFSYPNGETLQSAPTYRLVLKQLSAGLAVGSYYENCLANIFVTIYPQSGSYAIVPAQLILYNNQLELKFLSMPYAWTETITTLYIPPICINFPSMYC